jgi:hypothetical protein
MASTNSLPAEDLQKAILEDGVFCAEDPIVGKRVDEIAQKGFPFKTGFPSLPLSFPVVSFYAFMSTFPQLIANLHLLPGVTFTSTRFQPCPVHRKPVLDTLPSQAMTSHEMIINMAMALCPSIYTSLGEINELDAKATPKTCLSVATNATQLGFDYEGVVIQLMRAFQVFVESLPAVAHLSAFISFGRRIVASPHL